MVNGEILPVAKLTNEMAISHLQSRNTCQFSNIMDLPFALEIRIGRSVCRQPSIPALQ